MGLDKGCGELGEARPGVRDAVQVFEPPERCLDIYDERHSGSEERFISVGPFDGGIAVMVWTGRGDDVTRVISARWATPGERRHYYDRLQEYGA